MRIATIDVGTNTALLLIAKVRPQHIEPLYQEERFVRLGEGVDASGQVSEAAMQRLCTALKAYQERAAQWEVDTVIVAGTSASRDAENKDDLVRVVQEQTGLSYEILSGEEEALWSFTGTVSAFEAIEGACAVVDIGGGSTEVIVGEAASGAAEKTLSYRRSLNIGSVRLTERFFSSQPPAPTEVEAAEALVGRLFEEADIPLSPEIPFIATAGTATSLGLVDARASSGKTTGATTQLGASAVHRWRERLLGASFQEVLALEPSVLAGRADVFPAGVLILDVFMRHFGLPACRISPRSLRHGLALRFAQNAD